MSVNVEEWLYAIEFHEGTIDTDLQTAQALLDGRHDDVDPTSVEVLSDAGFLQEVLDFDGEVIFELMLPTGTYMGLYRP